MKILLITDVQEGYMNEFTQHIPQAIKKHVTHFNYDLIVATRFIDNNESLFKSELNIRNMTMISPQAKSNPIINEIADIMLMKSTYSSLTPDVRNLLTKNQVSEVYICGLNTETVILTTALELFDSGIIPKVLSNLCMSLAGPETNTMTLKILERAIGSNNIL
ncbi:hypothetical protein CS063_16590 [Sporanaerobium hydrogeniformans]|uniref:Uncharacterized protein n=1 Tax=Sporanaerobium hydrogeniformans TaxID=3072179 RepID=A0AC61D6F6_9FIRM|nr:isochorismatase family protein [Sporanaerobium hydrogeniformans]PHV69301.1 hypothetical protein CS063_16590 [Sporanaerobium hydrogeniformans]